MKVSFHLCALEWKKPLALGGEKEEDKTASSLDPFRVQLQLLPSPGCLMGILMLELFPKRK